MKIFNTLSKKKETFKPLKSGCVGIYLCGPTVYDKGHLGHARSAVAFDIIRKYFQYKGYKVTFVSNYTDIDDKIINRAREKGITVKELADNLIPIYQRDYGALGIAKPDISPKATEFIPQIVEIAEKLLAKGFAYSTDDGIYFSVRAFKDYGKLSHQNLAELAAGARVDINEMKKEPEDFALWKKEKPGEPAWEGPAAMRGRPGWHIECSAMSAALLGRTFDIHGGGQDLIFPHHEDEIAQSEAATGRPFAKYWLHNGFIRVNEEKMSKSLGNFFTIEDVLKTWNPAIVRYLLFSTHYRMPIDFADNLLEQARASLQRIRDFLRNVEAIAGGCAEADGSFTGEAEKNFRAAMDNDFEVSEALAVLFDFIKKVNTLMAEKTLSAGMAAAVLVFFKAVDKIFGVFFEEQEGLSAEVEALIARRNEARKNKDFAKADEIRDELKQKEIELEDTPRGTIWKKII